MISIALAVAAVLPPSRLGPAQEPSADLHTMLPWGIVHRDARMDTVEPRKLRFRARDGAELAFHLYRAPGGSAPSAAVVMAAATRQGTVLERAQYTSWARLLACSGLVAVVYDSRWGRHVTDLEDLVAHLRGNAGELGLRPDALGAFACSGNVFGHYEALLDPERAAVDCAAFYYGAPGTYSSSHGVPLLLALAGRDDPGLNARIRDLAARALGDGSPVELLAGPDLHHAFDILDDGPRARRIILRTVEFFRENLEGGDPGSPAEGALLRKAVAHFEYQEWPEAAAAYRLYLASRPDDARGWHRLGRAELGSLHYGPACEALTRAAELGWHPSTSFYDAACTSALDGRPDAAIELLSRALDAGFSDAAGLEGDPDLVSLRGRPDFRALLERLR